MVTHLLAPLSPEQAQRLTQLALDHPQENVRKRAQALLLLAHGHSVVAVARQLGVARRSIYYWLRRARLGGLDDLDDLPRAGRRAQTTAEYRDHLEFLLSRDPYEFRHEFPTMPQSGWTSRRLSRHLEADTGIAITPGHLRNLLKQWGFVYGAKRVLRVTTITMPALHIGDDLQFPSWMLRDEEEVILQSWSKKRRWKARPTDAAVKDEVIDGLEVEDSTPSMPTDGLGSGEKDTDTPERDDDWHSAENEDAFAQADAIMLRIAGRMKAGAGQGAQAGGDGK